VAAVGGTPPSAPAHALPAPGSAGAWLLAARPRTLPVAVAPVLVGTALAAAEASARPLAALAALAAALCLQIAANFANDAFDHEKGADTAERLGPPRAAAAGLLTPAALRRGMLAALAGAAAAGLPLVVLGGWPIAALGLASLAAAVGYTGGRFAFGYRGLGEAAVFFFFGLVAVGGTFAVQTGHVSAAALLASLPIGALASAVLLVNNVRDLETDRRAAKRTLAVRLGRRGALRLHALLVLGAYAALPLLWLAGPASAGVLAAGATLPFAAALVRRVAREQGPALNEALAATAKLEVAFAALLAAGCLL
jgi:1,4-dihydroxy-2-naphthoate octaprenyltransferase